MTLKAEKRARRAAEQAAAARNERMAFIDQPRIRCHFLAPVEPQLCRVSLRRYEGVAAGSPKCGRYGFHNAEVHLGDAPRDTFTLPALEDPRWPTRCDTCGKEFSAGAHSTLAEPPLYLRADTGALLTLSDAAPGAMWWAPWYSSKAKDGWMTGYDGRTLVVRLPDGRDWIVDSVASNCPIPKDRSHRCWLRQGEPPDVTAGKKAEKGEKTCSAGAGSIQTGSWHGFLRNGWLERC
jgi:hypothetical protein